MSDYDSKSIKTFQKRITLISCFTSFYKRQTRNSFSYYEIQVNRHNYKVSQDCTSTKPKNSRYPTKSPVIDLCTFSFRCQTLSKYKVYSPGCRRPDGTIMTPSINSSCKRTKSILTTSIILMKICIRSVIRNTKFRSEKVKT